MTVKVATWYDPRFGPALLATLPKKAGELPQLAYIPKNIPPGPARQLAAKGHDLTWVQWAEHLTERPPYGGQWSVEEVPDGLSAHAALNEVRQRAVERGLDLAKAK